MSSHVKSGHPRLVREGDRGRNCVGNVESTRTYRARLVSGITPIEPERRVVTVLYADIVGSTKIISQLDPDDAADFLDPAIDKVIRSIHNFGGTVARVQGDGVKAVFGATQTQEDHALRAAMAGPPATRNSKGQYTRRHALRVCDCSVAEK